MAEESQGTRVIVPKSFDFAALDETVAAQVQNAAQRIRQFIKQTVVGIIAIGNELLAVKLALGHGQFLPWVNTEFGWSERMAHNFMAVATRFGPKTEIIADLHIDPTAAYLLAAPSAPDAARQAAIARAEVGEHITQEVAREIVTSFRKSGSKGQVLSAAKLHDRLVKTVQRCRARWQPDEVAALAQRLREFAASLEPAATPVPPAC
jgi:hypothetical protein